MKKVVESNLLWNLNLVSFVKRRTTMLW